MNAYRHPDAIVETDWLAKNLENSALRVLDVTTHLHFDNVPAGAPYRVESGHQDFVGGHIPGADYVDLQGELSIQGAPFAFTLPSAAQFSEAMERHGIGDDTHLVLYSSTHPMWATRVWWMLRAFGFDRAAVLNGGLRKWKAEQRAISTSAPVPRPRATFTARPRPTLFATKEEVLAVIGNPRVCTINALAPDLYRGLNDRYGRRGRIPGSVNLPAAEMFEAASGTFKSADELTAVFASVCPREKTDRVILYCGGGIAATLDAFLMYQLGYDNLAVYDNSMSEWAKDESLPIEVD